MDRDNRPTDRMEYLDFDLEIGRGSARRYPVSARSPITGEAQAEMRFPYTEQVLENRLLALELAVLQLSGTRRRVASPKEQTAQDFGKALFDALFTGDLRSLYGESLRAAEQQGKGLRIRLHIEPPELAALPWEFLYDTRRGEYMCLSSQTPIVRYPDLPQSIEQLPVTPPLRILGMVVDAVDLAALDVAQEKARVEAALKDLQSRGAVDLVWLEGQTWRDLQRAMRRGPWHIFHFIGHGGFDRATDEGLIALADDASRSHLLRATDLGRLLDDHFALRLVLLNSCEGARGGDRDAFSGTAATLVRRGIPAVLAMQYEITDEAAVEFSRSFYEAVADGLPIDAAVSEARTAVGICLGDTLEWGTPVLYMRSPDGRVFDVHQPAGAGRNDQTTSQPREELVAPVVVAPGGSQPPDEPTEAGSTRGSVDTPDVVDAPREAPSAAQRPPAVRQDSESVQPVGAVPAAPRVSRRPSIPLLVALLVGGGLLLGVWLLFALRPDRISGALPAGQEATATARGQALIPPQTPRLTVPPRTNPRNGAVSSDAAMFRGNLAHTGVYPEAGPAPQEGQLVWRFTADGEEIDRPPAISGNTAYFGSRGGYLYAVDLENRVARWTFEAGGAVRSSPAVAGRTVYVGSDDRNLYAVDTTTGKERWTFRTDGPVYAAPAVAEGIVYAGSDDGHLYAIDAHTGKVQWKHKTGGPVTSSPAVDSGTVYVGSQDSRLYALDARSGKMQWSLKAGGGISSSPAVQDDLVYVGSKDSRLYAVDRDTGRPKWDVKTGGTVISSPALSHGLVLFGSHDQNLHAVDAETGKRRWAFKTRGYVGSSPSIVDDLVLFGSGDGFLYAVEVVSGRLRWRYETEGAVGTSPAIAGGIVYFGGLDGYLYAVR